MHPQNQPSPLKIAFTRLDPARHRLTIVRPNDTSESRDLETRSFLLHDLIHYAVETEAGLKNGFYGAVAAGAALADPGDLMGERLVVEQIDAAFTGAMKTAPAPEAFVTATSDFIKASGGVAPKWFDAAYVVAVRERLRGLQGRWRATAFGETMRLEF